MNTTLIELADGTYIEALVKDSDLETVSGGLPEKVTTSLEVITPIILRIASPLKTIWTELNKDLKTEAIEIELGLSFEAEGNIYVTRSKAEANLTVKISVSAIPSVSQTNPANHST